MRTRKELADALRVLAMDAVDKAKSGHPGAPMGMADMAEALWRGPLRHNPANPAWADRDRFVLSNGHASMLLYGLLHLTGYDLSMDDIRNFRQLDSRTPGHPEYGVTPGVETTTGAAGAGTRHGRGHGACRTFACRRIQPGRLSCRQSLDLRICRRRLPYGRSVAGGLLSGRDAGTRQAHRAVRR